MADEDAVCDAEVECDSNDDGNEAGPEATNEIGYVAHKPDEDEEEGDSFCVSVVVVFNQLGDLSVGDVVNIYRFFRLSYASKKYVPTRRSNMSTKQILKDQMQLHAPSRARIAPQRPQILAPGVS